MTMTMRERIARAATPQFDLINCREDFTQKAVDEFQEACLAKADAVLDAMREPTDLMGCGLSKMANQPYKPGSHSASEIWKAFIDAAKEER